MRILGVDLAAQPKNTSVALLEGNRVIDLLSSADDDAITERARECGAIGIDAPLGWPDAFVDVVNAHHRGEPTRPADPRSLQLRLTDRVVHHTTGKRPLSVSTDRIGVVALRAIGLLEHMVGPGADRAGGASVFETYPGGAVTAWSLVEGSYKRPDSTPQRTAIVDALATHLHLGPHRDRMIASDDDLDAVLSAVLAALATIGRTVPPLPDQRDVAQREGWIHIPSGPLTDIARLAH